MRTDYENRLRKSVIRFKKKLIKFILNGMN